MIVMTTGLVPAILLVCMANSALVREVSGQGPQLSTTDVKRIFASGGDVPGWDEFDVPEFVAGAYGPRARAAIMAILAEPSTPENSYFQVEALTAARYSGVGVPVALILQYARGEKGSNVGGGGLRHRAVMALQWRSDSSLAAFWLQVAQEPDLSFRQLAAGGLACALGRGALPHLEVLRRDRSPAVVQVAAYYLGEFATKGDDALACAGGRLTRREVPFYPRELRPSLRQKGARILQEVR